MTDAQRWEQLLRILSTLREKSWTVTTVTTDAYDGTIQDITVRVEKKP